MPKKRTENEMPLSTGAAAVPARRTTALPHSARARTKPAAAPAETAATAVLKAPATSTPSDREKIAARAYSYWVERGYQGGSPEEDWLRAEQELLQTV